MKHEQVGQESDYDSSREGLSVNYSELLYVFFVLIIVVVTVLTAIVGMHHIAHKFDEKELKRLKQENAEAMFQFKKASEERVRRNEEESKARQAEHEQWLRERFGRLK